MTLPKNSIVRFTSFSICNPEKKKCGDASFSGKVKVRDEECYLLLVADGVSSSPKDWLASGSTIEFIIEEIQNSTLKVPDAFLQSVIHANSKIFSGVENTIGMMSTICAALYQISENKIYLCSAGDSRIYGLKDESWVLLTKDDTESKQYIENGKPKLRKDGQPIFLYPINKAIGYSQTLNVSLKEIAGTEYEAFVLVTDGFYSLPGFESYVTSIAKSSDLEKESKQVQNAITSEIEDDASLAIIRLSQSEGIDLRNIVAGDLENQKILIDAVMTVLEDELRNAIETNEVDYLEQLITFMEFKNAFYGKEKMIELLGLMIKNNIPNHLIQRMKTIIWKL